MIRDSQDKEEDEDLQVIPSNYVPPTPKEFTPSTFKEAIQTPDFKKFLGILGAAGTIFLLLITTMMCYALGNLHHSTTKVHNLRMLAVDLDGGAIGAAMISGLESAQALTFPRFIVDNTTDHTPESVYHEVFKGNYWGAVYAAENATEQLHAALGDAQIAAEYDPTTALYYVWNQAHYTSMSNGVIKSSLVSIGTITQRALVAMHGRAMFGMVGQDPSDAQLQVLGTPVDSTEINIQPTPQLTAFLYNTICMVIVILIMFFFMLGTNMIAVENQIYAKVRPLVSFGTRHGFAFFFGFMYSLIATGAIWWFREGWVVNGNQFVLTWMSFWLMMAVNFVFLDCFACFFPPAVFPIVVLTWIIMNVMSAIVPLPLTPGFYHWSTALPGFNMYNLNTSIWARGASPIAYRALPILFGWLVISLVINVIGHYKRCEVARKAAGISCVDTRQILREAM
ncbi:uncharacterized protein SAPINGB_P005339 [Magnusiomyces paraingens]|uniref:DUF3533 domain-containing protein n=1 Tax=Magnusiomyces paraingens TaxID=2606893 RepID=A0A5E8C0F1_9ASCO|nr:uncharacterized protein SAPINGB_P005339 [Saprochaete ingens]VVT56852.1 unnamed protein product [Saprochaete ingens]